MVTVFDRLAPDDGGDGGGALYVAPPPGNTMSSVRPVEDAAVVDWESGHPVLAGLDGLDAVEAVRAVQLQLPSWGATVLTAASRHVAYPFLVVGDVRGRRRACLAAELPPRLAASDTMPLVLLTLATLRWLAEPIAARVRATGVPVRRRGARLPPRRGCTRSAILRGPRQRAGVHRARFRAVPTGWCSRACERRRSDVGRQDGVAN
jgi:hypothetical protein